MEISILPGKDLSPQDIETINAARLKEFGSTTKIQPTPENDDWNKVYFLAKQGTELVAFGRLHDVDVTFLGNTYHILGIATIIALQKGKGYGKYLMEAMKKYIETSGQTAVGFCGNHNTPFYRKCGFEIIVEGQNLFQNPTPSRHKNSDVLYISGKDRLIETMLEHPTEIAQISRPHW